MTRRPLAGGLVANRLLLAAVFFILLPWLADAQQQHQQPGSRHIRGLQSQQLDEQREHIPSAEATVLPAKVQHIDIGRDEADNAPSVAPGVGGTKSSDKITTKVVAPADLAVRAPSTRQSSIFNGAGITLHSARNLGDAEIEDFILMATVDGRIFARDRKTGREKWVVDIEQPIIEVVYPGRNLSTKREDDPPIYDLWWVVEPTGDGPIFLYISNGPHSGLVDLNLSMKKLVDRSPHIEGQYIYIGEKKSGVFTVDAENGDVVQYHGPEDSFVEICDSRDGLRYENCGKSKYFDMIRNEYHVTIRERSGKEVAKLKYAEWAPSNHNNEYQRQNQGSLDGKFWYSRHDGSVYAFEPLRNSAHERPLLYNTKLPSPVVRVFDVVRPLTEEKGVPNLTVLSQPPPAPWGVLEDDIDRRHSRVFVNQTERGDLFAMSGTRYPLAIDGPKHARCSHQNYLDDILSKPPQSKEEFQLALVGLHSIDGEKTRPLLTIDGVMNNSATASNSSTNQTLPASEPLPSLLDHAMQFPEVTKAYAKEFLWNPFTLLILVIVGFYNLRSLWRLQTGDVFTPPKLLGTPEDQITVSVTADKQFENGSAGTHADALEDAHVTNETSVPAASEVSEVTALDSPLKQITQSDNSAISNEELSVDDGSDDRSFTTAVSTQGSESTQSSPSDGGIRTKKQRRGKRGGARNRKALAKEGQTSIEDITEEEEKAVTRADGQSANMDGADDEEPTVDEVVHDAQRFATRGSLLPDVHSLATGNGRVGPPLLHIGSLVVNQEKLIGTGSNGTLVFEGKLGGRIVAVKRMLVQFYEIAAHETRLLEESDVHPNVIRYYIQHQSSGFLYIALEFCSAALSDVIERPYLHLALAESGERHLPNIMYQIANGLSHLHKLRIVHRDLKPQNILVKMGENGVPRMVVSDFGLCKKLENEQSSFGASVTNGAGTYGWRAPELLHEDDANDKTVSLDQSSITSNSATPLVATDQLPIRRATRAIDIFSLGLVYFYMLCKAAHPFDCGQGKFMREVNIRNSKYDLSALDAMGDDSFLAKHLIESMLSHAPKDRPDADQVMAHPFFWSKEKKLEFLCDVSDFFEKEKRDPPTAPLIALEEFAPCITHGDFLRPLGKEFLETLGKQRKYTGSRLLDLLRALRNKKNHYEDMPESLKIHIGPLPDGYLSFWTTKFPNLLINCWILIKRLHWQSTPRFRKYYHQPSPAAAPKELADRL